MNFRVSCKKIHQLLSSENIKINCAGLLFGSSKNTACRMQRSGRLLAKLFTKPIRKQLPTHLFDSQSFLRHSILSIHSDLFAVSHVLRGTYEALSAQQLEALRLLCLSVILDPLQGLQEHSFEAQTFLLFLFSTKQLKFEKCELKKSKRNLIRTPDPKCHTPPSAWWCTPARCTL